MAQNNGNITFDNQTLLVGSFHPDNCSYGQPGYSACYAGYFIHNYILPLILIGGFFGNTASFAIMLNNANRKVTCCLCFAVLAITDNIVLLSITIHRIKELQETDVDLCPFYAYLMNSSSGCSSYIIVLITCQRYNAVCHVFNEKLRITKKKAGWIMLLMIIAACLFQIPIIFTSNLRSATECAGYSSYGIVPTVWVWMNSIIFFFIPMAVVSYWNLRIYFELRIRRNDLGQSNSNSFPLSNSSSSPDLSSSTHHYNADRKLTRMMISISLGFICLSLPIHIRYMYYLQVTPNDNIGKATRFLMYQLTNKCFHRTKNCINCRSNQSRKFSNQSTNKVFDCTKWCIDKTIYCLK